MSGGYPAAQGWVSTKPVMGAEKAWAAFAKRKTMLVVPVKEVWRRFVTICQWEERGEEEMR